MLMPTAGEALSPHKILILATLTGGYRGADATGQSHLEYSPNTYILPVRTAAIFPPQFYLDAFARGIDGIIVMYSGTDSPYKGESERTAEIINATYAQMKRARPGHAPAAPGRDLYRLRAPVPQRNPEDERRAGRDRPCGRIDRPSRRQPPEPGMRSIAWQRRIFTWMPWSSAEGSPGCRLRWTWPTRGIRWRWWRRDPSIGGKMIGLSKVFPTLDCCSCITTPKMAAVAHHENIHLLTYSEVQSLDHHENGFTAQVLKKPRYVIEEDCTGCRSCELACPLDLPDDENEFGRTAHRVIYVPFSTAVPQKALIDIDRCIFCGKCLQSCPSDAIDFNQQPEHLAIEAQTIILATGYEVTPYDAKKEYGAGKLRNVIDGLMMERLLAPTGPYGRVLRPSDGKQPDSIAYVQCAGSRDQTLGVPYCSRVCCMYAIKQAMLLSGTLPMADITIYYMDIRTFGKGYEQFYQNAKAMGIEFVKGKVARITEDAGQNPIVRVEMLDEDSRVVERQHDLVVLSVGMLPGYDPQAVVRGGDGRRRLCPHPQLQRRACGDRPGGHLCDRDRGRPDGYRRQHHDGRRGGRRSRRLPAITQRTRGGRNRRREERGICLRHVRLPPADDEPRIGVYICHCGGNIGDTVQCEQVAAALAKLPNVTVARDHMFMCSDPGQQLIADDIAEKGINRVVVGACSIFLHEQTFRRTVARAGLNPYLYHHVGLREQDSWAHHGCPADGDRKSGPPDGGRDRQGAADAAAGAGAVAGRAACAGDRRRSGRAACGAVHRTAGPEGHADREEPFPRRPRGALGTRLSHGRGRDRPAAWTDPGRAGRTQHHAPYRGRADLCRRLRGQLRAAHPPAAARHGGGLRRRSCGDRRLPRGGARRAQLRLEPAQGHLPAL